MIPKSAIIPSWAVMTLLAVALVFACGQLASGPAWGHDSAAWIQANPAYVSADGVHCCGPNHCAVVGPGELVREAGGWLHVPTNTRLRDGVRGIYGSIDAQVWRCVRGGVFVCLFTVSGA